MIRIVQKGNQLYRSSPYYQIQVNGKTHTRQDGIKSYWTEADALRACAEEFGMVPQDKAKWVQEEAGNE